MSGERYLFEAVYNRLSTDATLVGLMNGGVWTGAIPDLNDVREVIYSGGASVFSGRTVATPTWIEMHADPGSRNASDASGDRFNDVSLRLECISLQGLLQAIDADERVNTLLIGWTPTISNWPNRWKVDMVNEGRSGGRAPPPLTRPLYRAWSVFRFRYGT